MRWTFLWLMWIPSSVYAHVGPPFPLFVDRPAGDDFVSVWTDPDIGQATFFIAMETKDGRAAEAPLSISLWVEPVSGRLARATYDGKRQKYRNRLQYLVEPFFDKSDRWRIGVIIQRHDGTIDELLSEVESTPPGTGPWDLLIYVFPFALVAALWIAAIIRLKRRRRTLFASDPAPPK